MLILTRKTLPFFILFQTLCTVAFAQYKSFEIASNRDTINIVDNKGLKQGKWVIKVPELRGEAAYVEAGYFKSGKKEGEWKKYNNTEDVLALENYRYGGKDGIQQYFTRFGNLIREESWKAYNPDSPYDTIPIYGTGSNEIIDMKIVKAEQYSVKHGEWKFYEASTNRLINTEHWDRGAPLKPVLSTDVATTPTTPKKIPKPQAVLDYEKKNAGKKKVKVRDGSTGY
ncbi:hypothetical protein BH09BAC2_BH09BAC2_11390 [soil metagenome]